MPHPRGSPSGIRTEATSRSRLRVGGMIEDARESLAIVSRCKRCAREDPRRVVLRSSVYPRFLVPSFPRSSKAARACLVVCSLFSWVHMQEGIGLLPTCMKRACKPCYGAITKHGARNHRKLCSQRLEARHALPRRVASPRLFISIGLPS